MSLTFNPNRGLIVVTAKIDGPTGEAFAQLALDTGAVLTIINTAILVSVGYDPPAESKTIAITTGSGVENALRMKIDKIEVLGQERTDFTIISHTLPPTAGVDGVLGLNFLRSQQLTLDFRTGQITLS